MGRQKKPDMLRVLRAKRRASDEVVSTDKPDKGHFQGSCNRTMCQNPPAIWYHRSTKEHYCETCMVLLNRANRSDALRLYDGPLCIPGVAQDGYRLIVGDGDSGDVIGNTFHQVTTVKQAFKLMELNGPPGYLQVQTDKQSAKELFDWIKTKEDQDPSWQLGYPIHVRCVLESDKVNMRHFSNYERADRGRPPEQAPYPRLYENYMLLLEHA